MSDSPIYVTPRDVEKERKIALALSKLTGQTFKRYEKETAPLDLWSEDFEGNITGKYEFKARKYTSTSFRTLYVSERKYKALMDTVERLNIPAYFIAQYLDWVRWVKVTDMEIVEWRMTGRTDRPEACNDIEKMALVTVRCMEDILRVDDGELIQTRGESRYVQTRS